MVKDEFQSIHIIWQDESLLVVDKPSGLPTLPDGWNPDAPYLKTTLENQHGRLWTVHRLDRETSGVLVFARTETAHRELNHQFEQHQVKKIYHAIVYGKPQWKTKIVNLPLRVNVGHRHRTVVDQRYGKPATTEFRLLESNDIFSLIEAVPITGRTHQIRVHLYANGLPIIGDHLYTYDETGLILPLKIPRCMLHARSLQILHPITGEQIKFQASYPDDFSEALTLLRKQ